VPRVQNLSATKVSTWRQCRRYFKFQYVDFQKPAFTPIEWESGSVVHNILAQLMIEFRSRKQFKARVGTPRNPRWFHKVFERAAAAMQQAVEAGEVRIIRPGDRVEDYFQQGERALTNFTAEVLPRLQGRRILGVEADLGNFRLARTPIRGRLDLVLQADRNSSGSPEPRMAATVEVHDWKTGRRREEDALQARFYYFAAVAKYRAPETTFSFHYLNCQPGEITETFEFSEDQLAELAEEVAEVRAAIESERDFAPQVSTLCHWCPYSPMCSEGQTFIHQHPLAGGGEVETLAL